MKAPMQDAIEDKNLMMPGDLFLMCGDAKSSEWLARIQKAIYNKAKSSHVMISMGDGAFVHATPDGGVNFTSYPSIADSMKDGWRVIRRSQLTQNNYDDLQKSTMFYAGQAYNYKFFLQGNDSSSFCSELAAKIYSMVGIELTAEKEPSKTTPAHLDRIADEGDPWKDVTDLYRNGFASIDDDPRTCAIGYFCFFSIINKRQMMLKMTDQLFDMLEKAKDGEPHMEKLRERFYKMEAEFRKNKNISFWDERKYTESKEGKGTESK